MWVTKGTGARVYFRVSTPPSSKSITEVGLAFEEILPQIGLLSHTEFCLLHFFFSGNPVPTIFLLILYLKTVSICHKYCVAWSSVCFSLFPHIPLPLPRAIHSSHSASVLSPPSPFSTALSSPFSVSSQPPTSLFLVLFFPFVLLFYPFFLEYDY